MFWLVIALYFISFWLIILTLALIFWPAQAVLRQQLEFYEKTSRQLENRALAETSPNFTFNSQALQTLKGRFLKSLTPLTSLLEQQFEAAGFNWHPGDFVLWHFLTLVLAGSLISIFAGLTLALLFVLTLALMPVAWLEIKKKQRQKQFSQQLPETLSLLATSLKAGYGLMQAFATVAQEAAEPMKSELEKLLLSSRLGLGTDEALEQMAARVNYQPFSWIVLAVKIQRQTGGNLADILETTANTLRQRETARRQVQVLTAEGRLSALILSALPFVIMLVLYFLNRQYILLLFSTFTGKSLLFLALLLILTGSLWFKKIVRGSNYGN